MFNQTFSYISKLFNIKSKSNTFQIFSLCLSYNKWCPIKWDFTKKSLVLNLFHLKWTKPKVNNHNLLTRAISLTIITHCIAPHNINYYNPLTRVGNVNNYNSLTRVIETRDKHFISLIQTCKTKYHSSTIFIFHKQRKCSNIFFMQNIYLIYA